MTWKRHNDPFNDLFVTMAKLIHPIDTQTLDTASAYRKPVTDLFETESEVVTTFELPGIDKSDIHLTITDVRVEVKVEPKGEKNSCHNSAGFYQSIHLPESVNSETTKATYKNGVLEVRIPKREKLSGKRIHIN